MAFTRLKNEQEMDSMSSTDITSDDDYCSSDGNSDPRKWWFQEPTVKRNKWTVILVFLLAFFGISSIIAGVGMEITYHSGMNDILRGLVFFAAGGLMLIPSIYALLHIYLAAKRVGRVRFSSVWFFTS